ncbi:MAG: hypothetical protein LBN39_08790 [Planctomycetaceae bacterium]|nr:hypothetical protein [Planctomycetaceae bacterium]
MHDIGEGTVRRIDWQELLPAVLLLRIFNAALGVRIMLLAFIGFGLNILLLSNLSVRKDFYAILPPHYNYQNLGLRHPIAEQLQHTVLVPALFFKQLGIEFLTFQAQPLIACFGSILIWLFFGGLILRTAALRLTVDESESLRQKLVFLRKRGLGFASSLIILSIGVLCCLLPVWFCGWLASFPALSHFICFLLPVPMLFAFLAAILTAGLIFGFPLLLAAVAVEGADGFDAVSRMFSYLYQRPLHYALYWIYAAVLGFAGYAVVSFFIWATLYLTAMCFPTNIGMFGNQHVSTMRFGWCSFIPTAYLFSWFWTSSAAIYILLRRSVDATPFDDVYRLKKPEPLPLPKMEIKEL